MRHYFGYDIDGGLRSYESYGPAGWPTNACLADPACVAKSVTSLRESRTGTAPDIINWVLFDCPCDPGQGALLKDCKCASNRFGESYVDVSTKTLRPKPTRTVMIDGNPVDLNSTITKNPGETVVLKVVSAGMPDGAKIHCAQKGMADIALEPEWDLLVSNGESDTKVLTAPAQGTKGVVIMSGRLFRGFSFQLRGFAIA